MILYIDYSQSIMRRQFNQTYQETITLVKQLKNSNDYLNRAIGVESNTNIALRLKRQKPVIDNNLKKIQGLVHKLQLSYLDPDTARKIGTVKQQFRIQKDRRKDLLINAELDQQIHENVVSVIPKHPKQSQLTSFQSFREEKNDTSTWNRFLPKQTESTVRTQNNSEYQREQAPGLSYQFQHKIMRQRNQQINNVSKNLLNVHSVIQQTGHMVHQQGQKIDIIGDQLFQTYKNAREARQNLSEANDHQRRARRKYVYFSLIVLLGVAVAVLVLML